MYLFGGLFFPLDVMPGWAQALGRLNPMYYLTGALRACCSGDLGPRVWLTILGLLAAALPLLTLAILLMRRRLIK